ncbi:MAG TPA: N(G),N(G)-dimethylarginine dimethylaminohydrolase [Gemmatimonadales bacterium]|nr:N(G),N(G)-dimethylarginine dimethylaminohydrolase [Gemmatimonadales bacterium]
MFPTRLLALTRAVSPRIAECELTFLARDPIDYRRAESQHAAYERCLEELGAVVERVPGDPAWADGVFIEDTAVVLDEVAVVTRPGAASRRGEVAGLAEALGRYRRVAAIEAPGTLDGGDVLRVGRLLYVGRSTRSDAEGIAQLARLVTRWGYTVVPVEFGGCLHLKSAATRVAETTVLLNPGWVAPHTFHGLDLVETHPAEPSAANALPCGDRLIYPAACPRTADRLARHGLRLRTVDLSELARAEGGVTCCSLLVSA